jgi:hypothetical protein
VSEQRRGGDDGGDRRGGGIPVEEEQGAPCVARSGGRVPVQGATRVSDDREEKRRRKTGTTSPTASFHGRQWLGGRGTQGGGACARAEEMQGVLGCGKG